jgi:mannose-6-phosphate isomerase-like protein (cupin superfamily)
VAARAADHSVNYIAGLLSGFGVVSSAWRARGSGTMEKVNLADKFGQFNDYWNPKIVGELNDSYIKLAKLKGEFIWHRHDAEDELFLVVKGELLLKFREGQIRLGEGDFVIVPKGVEHLPIAETEAHIILIEPKSTLNTGNVVNDKTVSAPDRI